MNKDLRPEDFWPDAEKLLDKHYKAKRQRKFILWFIAALTIVSATFYFIAEKKGENSTSNVLGKNEVIPPKFNSSDINTNPTKETSIQSNDRSIKATQEKNTIATNGKLTSNTQVENSNKAAKKSTAIASSSHLNSNQPNSRQENFVQTKKENPIKIKNENTNPKDAFANSTTPQQKTENTTIASLSGPLFKGIKYNTLPTQTAIDRNPELPKPKSNHTAEYRLDISAGANLMSKTISGYENEVVFNKRNNGEDQVVTPQLSVELSRVCEKYAVSIGLSYVQYGEKVNYDPTVNSKVAIDNSYWNTYTTTYVDTDTNFVYGYVYFSQQTLQRMDSNYVAQTDTIVQTGTNDKLLKSKGTNVISYLEVPITASYYFGKKKFRYGISAGVSTGFLIYSDGYYLNSAGTDLVMINEDKIIRKVIFNGLIGLDLRYSLSPYTHLLLRPQYRTNLNSIFEDHTGVQQKYSAVGVTAGISFLLH